MRRNRGLSFHRSNAWLKQLLQRACMVESIALLSVGAMLAYLRLPAWIARTKPFEAIALYVLPLAMLSQVVWRRQRKKTALPDASCIRQAPQVVCKLCESTPQARRKEKERDVLSRLAVKLSGADTLEALAQRILESTEELWNWDAFAFSIRLPGRVRFHTVLAVDTVAGVREFLKLDTFVPTENCENPVIKGESVLINRQNPANSPWLQPFGNENKPSASLLFAPVRRAEDVIGILSIQSYTTGHFNEEDLDCLQQMADTIVPALTRFQAQTRSAAFSSLGQKLSGTISPYEAAQTIVAVADELLTWDSCYVATYSPETGRLHRILLADIVDGARCYASSLPTNVPVTSLVARRTIEEGAQLILNEEGGREELNSFGDQSRRSASLMFVPIRSSARVVGILSIQSYTPCAYDEECLQILQALADHCSGALERIRTNAELHALFAAMNDLIVVFDANGRYLKVAPSMNPQLFSSAEQLVGKTMHELFPRELAEAWLKAVHKALREQRPVSLEYRLSAEQRERWYFGTFSPMPDSTVLCVARDITERKKAEQNILQQAQRSQTLARLASRLTQTLHLDSVLNLVCEETARALNVGITFVAIYDQHNDTLAHAANVGLPESLVQSTAPVPRQLFEDLMRQSNSPLFVRDIDNTQIVNREAFAELGVQTLATACMLREGMLIGTLTVASTCKRQLWDEDQLTLLKAIADQAAMAVSNARLFSQVKQGLERVQALRDIDLVLTASLDLRLSLDAIIERVISQLRVDAAQILLLNPINSQLEYGAGRGFRSSVHKKDVHVRLGEGYAGRVALTRESITIPDLRETSNKLSRIMHQANENFVTYVAIPLIAKGQVKGVLEVFHRSPRDTDHEWLSFLEALAGQAAIAIENTTMFDDLQRSNMELAAAYDATIEGWSNALDLRDKETEGHTQRVTEMTVQLAEAMGMPRQQLVHIRRGALLHDIGKMGIPDSILLKPGPLSEEEWTIMRKHPVYAYQLLAPIAFLRPALEIPYCHHERWDGSGYPRGLAEEQIPKTARIFAVIDVWDALTSDRPYRPAMPKDKVRDYIAANSATHFDPEVVKVFLKHFV